MVTIHIKSAQQNLQKYITFGHTQCRSKKKSKLFVNHSYPIKMCFFHIYILGKYFKHKFTITYFSSLHAHTYTICQFGETRMFQRKMVEAK